MELKKAARVRHPIATLRLMGVMCLVFAAMPFSTLAGTTTSEQVRFHHLTTRDGLSHPSIVSIQQDRSGFMWFASNNGLARYDGYEMTIYRYDPADQHSIRSNDIISLYKDISGNLWIGASNDGGLHLYDDNKDRFIRIGDESAENTTLGNSVIWDMQSRDDETLWVGTTNGLYLLDVPNLTVEKHLTEDPDRGGLSSHNVVALLRDHQERLWIGTDNGLDLMNSGKDSMMTFRHDPGDDRGLPSNDIQSIYEDDNGTIWVGTGEGLARFDAENHSFISYVGRGGLPDDIINSILEDQQGRFWIGTAQNGLIQFDRDQHTLRNHDHDPDNRYSISEGAINTLYESSDGILWAGTRTDGVSYLDRSLHLFTHYARGIGNGGGPGSNLIRAFVQDASGDIWMGTEQGLNRFDPETEQFERFRDVRGDMQSVQSSVIIDLCLDNRNLWLGTYDTGLGLVNLDDYSVRWFRHDPEEPYSLSNDDVFGTFVDSDGVLWVGTNGGGLNRLEPDGTRFTRFKNDPSDPNSIGNNDVRALHEDRQGTFWIGTYSGKLTRFDRDEERFYHYDINEGRHYRNSVVQDVLEDSRGRLWLASRGGGLIQFDRDTGTVAQSYTVADGLPGNIVHAILEDENGILWMSTNSGLSRFNPALETFRNYDEISGIQRSDFFPFSKLKSQNGEFYFGGFNGFNRFDPEELSLSNEPHPVVLTGFLMSNRPVPLGGDSPLREHISRLDTLILPYDASMLTFRYSALNFSANKANRFAYKLEGFDGDWHFVGNRRSATYTNLSPGEYEFQVMATNNDGIWPDSTTRLALVITPPFWMTSSFLVTVLLGGGMLLLFIYRMRVRVIQGRNRKLRKIVADRTRKLKESNATKDRILSIIAHDLNNIAFGMVGMVDLLKESVDNKNMEEIEDYTRRLDQNSEQFHVMLRNLLNWARAQSGRIEYHPEVLSLSGVLEEHIRQEEIRARNKSIQLYTSVNPDTEIEVYTDRQMLSAILRNLINNALKFTHEGGEVELAVTDMDSEVQIAVIDNGVGMTREQRDKIIRGKTGVSTKGTGMERGTGLGLSVALDFIRKSGGELQIESEEGSGSRFSFTVPKHNGSKKANEQENHSKDA